MSPRGTAARGSGRATAYGFTRRAAIAAGLVTAALCAPASAASPTGGASPEAAKPAPDSAASAPKLGPTPFGVRLPAPATIRSFRCLTGCADTRTPLTGALLRVRGRNLSGTTLVTFLGGRRDADDVSAKPQRRTRTAVDVRVPLGALSGPVAVTHSTGLRSTSRAALTVAPGRAGAPRTLVAEGPQVEVQVADPRGFVDAAVPPHVTYVLHGADAADVTVEIVRDADGTIVTSWPGGRVVAETPQTASWDGTVDGRLQKAGRYSFRVTAAVGGARATSSQAGAPEAGGGEDPASFVLLGHVFPVRGPHYYGEGAARFGGGRGHQGQDVFAACGTPIVAARGGKVQFKGYHSAAGNYLVLDGARTGHDYTYMHLRSAALVKQGQRVRTGQLLGYVGDTGRASACHLHMELWSAPGWYAGGSPFDPLPSLLSWDRAS